MSQGLFITFEGSEGAGKSSNLEWAADYLREQGKTVITTREPGGTEVSEAIRGVLLSTELPAMHSDTELLLMFAARNEHIQRKIKPALAQGTWVLCDRFTDASYAYQGYGRGLSLERIATLETWVQGALRPDATFLFDLDIAIGMQRAKARSAADRFEQEELAFFERVRQGYLTRAKERSQQYRVLDASQTLEQVRSQLQTQLQGLI